MCIRDIIKNGRLRDLCISRHTHAHSRYGMSMQVWEAADRNDLRVSLDNILTDRISGQCDTTRNVTWHVSCYLNTPASLLIQLRRIHCHVSIFVMYSLLTNYQLYHTGPENTAYAKFYASRPLKLLAQRYIFRRWDVYKVSFASQIAQSRRCEGRSKCTCMLLLHANDSLKQLALGSMG